jgi:hypothetical protein
MFFSNLSAMLMHIMPTRYNSLISILAGYKKTGVPLVGYFPENGGTFLASCSDDQGIYYFIPFIAKHFSISINASLLLFWATLLLVSFIIGITFLFMTFKKWPERVYIVLGSLFLYNTTCKLGDAYMMFTITVYLVVPLCLFLADREFKSQNDIFSGICFFASGIITGLSNYIRGSSGTGVVLFVLSILIFYCKASVKRKISFLLLIVVGLSLPVVFFHAMINKRNEFLLSVNKNYVPPVNGHVFWHNVYLGFSFCKNDQIKGFIDQIASEKVKSINPDVVYCSKEYEDIIRTETFKFVREHKHLAVKTIADKTFNLITIFIKYMNIGLVLLLFPRLFLKKFTIHAAFIGALAFNLLFGILVLPEPQYVLGFIAFSSLYGIFCFSQVYEFFFKKLTHQTQ